MALASRVVTEQRLCDVFGIGRGTKAYKIQVVDVATGEVVFERPRDLSVRGITRLKRYIAKGLGKPGFPWNPEATTGQPVAEVAASPEAPTAID